MRAFIASFLGAIALLLFGGSMVEAYRDDAFVRPRLGSPARSYCTLDIGVKINYALPETLVETFRRNVFTSFLGIQASSSLIIRRTISVTATAKLVSLSSSDAGVEQRNARANVLSLDGVTR